MLRGTVIIVACLAACFGLNLLLHEFIQDSLIHLVNLCGISIILAVGLNVINGIAGQFSLGHAGFMAVGAYVGSFITTRLSYFDAGAGGYITVEPLITGLSGFLVALLFAGVAAAVLGVVVGAPALRLRGDYLAIATLGVGEIVQIIINDWKAVGGAQGMSGIPSMPDLPLIVGKGNASAPFWILGCAALAVVFTARLQRSTFGRALVAIRENELAAETMGIRTSRLKVMAFVYGAFLAGVAGALYARYQLTIRADNFTFVRSIEVVVMLVLGGLGSLTGAIVGAISMTLLPELLRPVEEAIGVRGLRMVVYALVLILLMLFRPQGIFGQRELSLRLLRSLWPGRGKDGGGGPPAPFAPEQYAQAKTLMARPPQTLPPEGR